MERHREKAGIIYAIARTKVEELSDTLNRLGFRTLPYHAGLTNLQRQRHQEALIHDEIDAIVATVAFGMGIDKLNVRYVIHAEMPRSLESYVQESGRAGRDAMPAECWLFHAAGDYQTWLRMIEESGKENREQALRSLHDMHEYCHGVTCRHRHLVEYFGQTLDTPCGACDICLGRVMVVDDPLRVSQMILSCVLRCEERFGADYISRVLTGSRALKIMRFSHHKLSTWGLLKGTDRIQVRDWIDQLRAQKLLTQEGQHPVLKVTSVGRKVLRGEVTPNLMKTVRQSISVTSTRILDSWEGVDRALFERLRQLRQTLATEADVASFVVFSDATLRDLARRRPTTLECLLAVHGMGQHKATSYGDRLMSLIRLWCREHGVSGDVFWPEDSGQCGERDPQPSAGARASFELFDRQWSVDQVADHMERAHSTVCRYLEHYIAARGITDPTRWVDARTVQRVEVAACYNDTGRLKPLYEAFHQQVSYEQIRIVLACLRNRPQRHA
jgi:ATP-dependent DNA helicase RecQ